MVWGESSLFQCKMSLEGYRFPAQGEPEERGQPGDDGGTQMIMQDRGLQTLEQARRFLEGSEPVEFRSGTTQERYSWIDEVLMRFRYHLLSVM